MVRAESKSDVTAPAQEPKVSDETSEKQEKTTVEEGTAQENGDSLFVVVVVVVKISLSHSCSFMKSTHANKRKSEIELKRQSDVFKAL